YSLNDTIVVFDRIRENFRKLRKGTPLEIVNISLNQTLSRTLMTSVTTLIVLLALFFMGGEIIHGFALALIVGVLVGTYSSIYVASSTILALGVSKEDLMPPQKEGEEQPDSVV
ncbi:MAG: protein translocase subunit SecF, partial [Gammaproteobacteria bacterium]|nr:protein translocase subunit SecF [Gammaproteobacteria bacterium]